MKPLQQQIKESQAAIGARDRAMQTPEEVRKAFLAGAIDVGPVTLQPLSLGMLMLFEQLEHPFQQAAQGKLSITDSMRAIYIFSAPEDAAESLRGGVGEFDQAAQALACSIAPEYLTPIVEAVAQLFEQGMSTMSGGGGSPPEG